MKYWWVNQNQTHKHEIGNGYMWSPKNSRGGAKNQFYTNMTLVSVGDKIFSFSKQKISFIGTVISQAYESPKPEEFGNAGADWSSLGWKVDVEWIPTTEEVIPKNIIEQLAPLLPKKYSPIRSDGSGNQVYLCEISQAMASLLLHKSKDPSHIHDDMVVEDDNEIIRGIESDPSIDSTEKENLINARRGQGKFRSRLEKIENCCRVTKLADRRFLVASHIKPWRVSSNFERLDGNNGLLLTPNVDKLFDAGYISFSDDGKMITSSLITHETLTSLNVNPTLKDFGEFNSRQREYLAYHRKNVLKV